MYRVCGLAWLLICIHTPIIDILLFFFLVIQTFSVYLVVHNYQHNLPRYSLIPGAYEQRTYPADLLSSFSQGDMVCWSSMRSCKYAAHEQYCAMNSCITGCHASVGCIFLPLVTVETRMKVTCSGVGSISWLVRCSSAGCPPLQMPPRTVCPSAGCPPGQSALGQSVPRGHSTLGQTVPP